MKTARPIIWKVCLARRQHEVFEHLMSDALRTRYWARSSRTTEDGFVLEFTGGVTTEVKIVEAQAPKRLRLIYFDAPVDIELSAYERGTLMTVSDIGESQADWLDRYAGWVNWLLVFKAFVDHGIDLRNGEEHRTWSAGYADQ